MRLTTNSGPICNNSSPENTCYVENPGLRRQRVENLTNLRGESVLFFNLLLSTYMKVIKVGGGCLKGEAAIGQILELMATRGPGNIFVASALNGVTDFLIRGMKEALAQEEQVPQIIHKLREIHLGVARYVIGECREYEQFCKDFEQSLKKLERLYYGLNFTREITPRLYDMISSFGERFAVELLVYTLRCQGMQALYRMPEKIGLITDGVFGDATANLAKTAKNFEQQLVPLLNKDAIIFIPGFFGISEQGDVTTFGRGGSDYAAAVIAAAAQAEKLEIWKDVAGFMSADPKFVPEAQLIPVLSYEEAAELAYFGAKILHPRTIDPVRKKRLEIEIRNTLAPDTQGSVITSESPRAKFLIKSVAHNAAIGVIKIHASGVGARPGILGHVADRLAEQGLNIKSVVTSQTCISLLLDAVDLDAGYHALKTMTPKPYQRIEKLDNVAMIGIVGEGLLQSKGIAAQCFTAVAKSGINIEMISMGPSRAALYFLVHHEELHKAVSAIHATFFPEQPVESQ